MKTGKQPDTQVRENVSGRVNYVGKGLEGKGYRACFSNCKSLVLLECSVQSGERQGWRKGHYKLHLPR